MGFNIRYSRLFAVELLHGFHLNQGNGKSFEAHLSAVKDKIVEDYDVSQDLYIIPTHKTAQVLRNRKLIFRSTRTGFFVGTALNQGALIAGQDKAAIAIDEAITLTFSVHVKNPHFFNFTNLRLDDNRHNPYYFSNKANNSKGNELHLSKPVKGFDSLMTYQAGDVIVDDESAPSALFEAVKANGPGTQDLTDWQEISPVPTPQPTAPYNTGDALVLNNSLFVAREVTSSNPPGPEWEETQLSHQSVTHHDRMPMYPQVFGIDITTAGVSAAVLKLIRPGETQPVFVQEESATPIMTLFPVNMQEVEAGLYEFRLETASGTQIPTAYDGLFYLDQDLYNAQVFALVELSFTPGEDLGEYNWVNSDEELRSPEYRIQFRNRTTFWRYIFNQDQSVADAALGELERDGPATEKKKFRTRIPQPLIQAFQSVKKFDSNDLLPNPTINLVKPDPVDNKIYSEIFIQN